MPWHAVVNGGENPADHAWGTRVDVAVGLDPASGDAPDTRQDLLGSCVPCRHGIFLVSDGSDGGEGSAVDDVFGSCDGRGAVGRAACGTRPRGAGSSPPDEHPRHLTLILARELRGRNVTVNAVAPGPTATELFFDGKDKATIEHLASQPPLERLGTPEDIAEVIAFLASPAGHWINARSFARTEGSSDGANDGAKREHLAFHS